MRISDSVMKRILALLEECGGSAEIQRNELAMDIGCVPSQINYVITSRFTPEHGYIVESRRGGGGYIRITRVSMNPKSALMHVINSIGSSVDASSANIMLLNLSERGLITKEEEALIKSAISVNSLFSVPAQERSFIRAAILKNMLLAVMNISK